MASLCRGHSTGDYEVRVLVIASSASRAVHSHWDNEGGFGENHPCRRRIVCGLAPHLQSGNAGTVSGFEQHQVGCNDVRVSENRPFHETTPAEE